MNRRGFLSGLVAGTTAGVALMAPSRSWAAPKPVIQQGFRLVIDPGHGGENHGCLAHGGDLHEKQLTLVIAQRLAGRVGELMPHAEILLTRERDETLHLAQRVGFANDCDADLFLSLHCNASPHGDQTGYETFLLDLEASNKDAALTAQRENETQREDGQRRRGAGPGGDDVARMLGELGMSHNRSRAAHYAAAIQGEHGRRFPDRIDRGVRQAAFDVLMGARMPAVLHEVGFLDHPQEGAMLRSDVGQGEIVEAVAQATLRYYNEIVRRE